MTRRKSQTLSHIIATLIIPILIGLGLYMLLELLIDRQVITNELLLRYLTGHPISRITTFMFFIGVAALLVIANNIFDQFCNCDRIKLANPEETPESGTVRTVTAEHAAVLLEQLDEHRRSVKGQYLWLRLASALGFIHRTGSTSGIEDELKYLADVDHDRQQRRYSLVRIVIWATPMLGFLGTVLGISDALGSIQVGPDNNFQEMLNGMRASLFVAFDTTALALTLSILLMFIQFLVDRFELQLLDIVDRRAHEELLPIYKDNVFLDPQTRAVEQIGRSLVAAAHDLARQQTEVWQQSMKSAESAWIGTISGVSETVRLNLVDSLQLAVRELAEAIANGVRNADESMASRWEQWQVLLSENARQLNQQQSHMLQQTGLVQQVLQQIENVNGVQQMLNRNLDTLAATSRLPGLQPESELIHFRKDNAERKPKPSTLTTNLRVKRDAA